MIKQTQTENTPELPSDEPKPLDLVKRRDGHSHVEKIIELPAAKSKEKTPRDLAFEVGEEARVKMAMMDLDINSMTPKKLKDVYTFGRVMSRNGLVSKMVQTNLIKGIQRTELHIKRFEKWLAACEGIEGVPDNDVLQRDLMEAMQQYEMQYATLNEKLLKAGILVPVVDVPTPTNNPFKAGASVTPGATYVSTQNATFNTPPTKE